MSSTHCALRFLVFDLDETLVHASSESDWLAQGFTSAQIDACGAHRLDVVGTDASPMRIQIRPHAIELLRNAHLQLGFELYVFTAGTKEYAHALFDQLLDVGAQVVPRNRIFSRADTTLSSDQRMHQKSLHPIIAAAMVEFADDDRMECATLTSDDFLVVDDRIDCWRDAVCHYGVLQVPRYVPGLSGSVKENCPSPVLRYVQHILGEVVAYMRKNRDSTLEDALMHQDLFLVGAVFAMGTSMPQELAYSFIDPNKWRYLPRYGAELTLLPPRCPSVAQRARITHVLTTDSNDPVLDFVKQIKGKHVFAIDPGMLTLAILHRVRPEHFFTSSISSDSAAASAR